MSDPADGKGVLTGDGPLGLRGLPGLLANLGVVGVILGIFWLQQRDIADQARMDRQATLATTDKQWQIMRDNQSILDRLATTMRDLQQAIGRQTAVIEELSRKRSHDKQAPEEESP